MAIDANLPPCRLPRLARCQAKGAAPAAPALRGGAPGLEPVSAAWISGNGWVTDAPRPAGGWRGESVMKIPTGQPPDPRGAWAPADHAKPARNAAQWVAKDAPAAQAAPRAALPVTVSIAARALARSAD